MTGESVTEQTLGLLILITIISEVPLMTLVRYADEGKVENMVSGNENHH